MEEEPTSPDPQPVEYPVRNFTRSQRLVSAFVLTVLVLIAAIGITSQIKTNLILVTPGPVYNLAT